MQCNSSNLETVKSAAEFYQNVLGFKLIKLLPKKKRPAGRKGVAFNITKAENFRDSDNIGVHLGKSKVCSLDIDHEESFNKILSNYGYVLPEAPLMRGSGKRYLFQVPDGIELSYKELKWKDENDKPFMVVELRAGGEKDNRQDVLPPSIHPDTNKPYVWVTPPVETLPEPPKWLLDIWLNWDQVEGELKALDPNKIDNPPLPPEPERNVHVERIIENSKPPKDKDSVIDAFNRSHCIRETLENNGYKKRRKNEYVSPYSHTAKQGGGGVTVFDEKNACYIHSASDPLHCFGKQLRGPFEFYRYYEHDGDYKRAVRAAAELLGMDYKSQPATLDDFQKVVEIGSGGGGEKEDSLFTKLGELEVKPTDWLIKGALESDALTVLYGQPGHGKSFLAIDMACCIATGKAWHGLPIKKQGAVFYLAGEGLNGLGRRFEAWSLHHHLNLKDHPIYPSKRGIDLKNKEKTHGVIEAIRKSGENPSLIVIDTLARNFIGEENSSQDMGEFISNVDLIRNEFHCGVVIVHHSGKDKERGARGSTALKGAVDAEYSCSKDGNGAIVLRNEKMKDAEQPKDKKFKLMGVDLNLFDDDEEAVTSAVAIQIDDDGQSNSEDYIVVVRNVWDFSGNEVIDYEGKEVPFFSRESFLKFQIEVRGASKSTASRKVRPSCIHETFGPLAGSGVVQFKGGFVASGEVAETLLSNEDDNLF